MFKDKLNFKYPGGNGYKPHIDGHFLWSDKNKSTNFVNNSKVIQYNKKTFKSDFLDIFLSSEARFFIGNTSGITSVPKILGTPVGVCNQIGFNFLLNQKNSLTIYKKLFCVKKNKFLTYNDLLKRGLFDKIQGWDLQNTSYLMDQHLIYWREIQLLNE